MKKLITITVTIIVLAYSLGAVANSDHNPVKSLQHQAQSAKLQQLNN